MRRPGRPKLWFGLGIAAVVVSLGGFGAQKIRRVEGTGNLPTAPARKGEFLEIVGCRGELIAKRSVQLTAPYNVPDLRIVWLAPANSPVKTGDVVIRFDPSSAKQQLAEKEAALKQAQATLDQAVAHARITGEQDKLDLSAARHRVERARLEVSKQEIVSALQGEESKVDFQLAEEKQRVQEAATNLHKVSDEAKIASLTRVRDKAKHEVELTQRRLERMEIRTPLEGVIIYMPNTSQGWINAKPFKVGDRAWPGGAIAEIPDLNTLEIKGKVEEIDRGRIGIGNEVRVHVDSLPEKPLKAELTLISPLTEQNFEWPPSRNFRAHAQIRQPDQRLRPGMNGRMDVIVNRIPGAISVPSKAVFTRQGKPIVYVATARGFRPTEVEVMARNPDEVAIRGIEAGQSVALVEADPKGKTR